MLKDNATARDRVLSADEFNRLMEALPSHTRAIVVTGYYGGMRKGEVLNLTWNHIDMNMKSRIISLEASETKDREARKITGHSTREMFLRYDAVDSLDTRKVVDQMKRFLKSVDQNVDQLPLKAKEG